MVVSFGIFGVILSITIIALFLYYAQFLPPKRGGTLEYQFIYAVTLFYFFESCVSFTLWMHKGLYLWIGLLMILPQMIQSTNKKKRNNI